MGEREKGRRGERNVGIFKEKRCQKPGCKSSYKCDLYQGPVWDNEKGDEIISDYQPGIK
jgi:hypothetical protein